MKTAIVIVIVLVSLVCAFPNISMKPMVCENLGEPCGGTDGSSNSKICVSYGPMLVCIPNECKDKQAGDPCRGKSGHTCVIDSAVLKCAVTPTRTRRTFHECEDKYVGDACVLTGDQHGECMYPTPDCTAADGTCYLKCRPAI